MGKGEGRQAYRFGCKIEGFALDSTRFGMYNTGYHPME